MCFNIILNRRELNHNMAATTQMTVQQQNLLARQLILANAVEMTQQIFSQTVTPSQQNVLNVTPRNVGLLKGFFVEVTATVTNTAGAATLLTDFNAANILSQITFTDLNNQVRINTTGWHLEFLNTVKRGRVFGSSVASDSPIKYGSNFNVISATASVAASGTGTVKMIYWVPLSYGNDDLRGSIYANVVNATMNLQLTLNTSGVLASGTDDTLAVYSGNAGSITSATVTVYQNYLDQIPQGTGGPVLPIADLSTIYEIKNTTFSGIVAGQDFPMQYANFRDFVSTFLVYYNGTARGVGADVNYLSLQAANTTNIFKVDPFLQALKTRNRMSTDFPKGTYYFDSRHKPVSTLQYGNMQLILNPSTAGAGAYALVGYEAFAYLNTLTQAGSLAAS